MQDATIQHGDRKQGKKPTYPRRESHNDAENRNRGQGLSEPLGCSGVLVPANITRTHDNLERSVRTFCRKDDTDAPRGTPKVSEHKARRKRCNDSKNDKLQHEKQHEGRTADELAPKVYVDDVLRSRDKRQDLNNVTDEYRDKEPIVYIDEEL